MQPPPLLSSRTFSFPAEGNPIPIKQSLPLLASPSPWKLLTSTKWWSCLHIQPEASPPQLLISNENSATSYKAEISNRAVSINASQEMATHSSFLAWRIPRTIPWACPMGAWRATVHGIVKRVGHNWATNTHTHTHTHTQILYKLSHIIWSLSIRWKSQLTS